MIRTAEGHLTDVHPSSSRTHRRARPTWFTVAVSSAGAVILGVLVPLLSGPYQVPIAVGVVVAAFACAFGAPSLLILVAVPLRTAVPGPFNSISFFELAIPFALAHELARNRSNARRSIAWFVPVFAIYAFWLLLSGVWAADRLLWLRSLILLSEGIAIAVAFFMWARRHRLLAVWRWWVVLGAVSAAVALTWYILLGRPEWINLTPPANPDEAYSQLLRLGSPFWGPSNYFASMLLLFLPFAFWSRLSAWLRYAILLLGGLAMAGTLSRGSVLALIVGPIVALILVRPSQRPALGGRSLLLAGVAFAALVAGLLIETLSRPDLQSDFFHDPNRVSYYEQATRLFANRPVSGYGFGSWPSLVVGFAARGVHDYYLQIAVEAGVIGAALFVTVLVGLFVYARQLPGDLAFTVTMVLAMVAVNIAVEATFEGAVFSWLFAMFIGIVLAVPRVARMASSPTSVVALRTDPSEAYPRTLQPPRVRERPWPPVARAWVSRS